MRQPGGVAQVLEAVRTSAVEKMRTRLLERREQGYLDCPDGEIESIARIAGLVAREVCGDGVGEAFQMGCHKNATPADHEAVTRRIETPKPGL
jgi:cobalamin biosynthesis Mg chelatase CobN